MPAFKESVTSTLNANIKTLYERMQQTNEINLTHEDMLVLFAPEQDRDLLRRAREVGEISWSSVRDSIQNSWIGGDKITYYMHEAGKPHGHPLWPKKPALQRNDEALEILGRIENWLERRLELGRDYSRVQRVLHLLNEKCPTPAHVKFFWPSIIGLCRMSEITKPIGRMMENSHTPSNVPTLSPELKAACRKTAGAIAVVGLISEEETKHTPEVTLSVEGGMVSEEGLGAWRSY